MPAPAEEPRTHACGDARQRGGAGVSVPSSRGPEARSRALVRRRARYRRITRRRRRWSRLLRGRTRTPLRRGALGSVDLLGRRDDLHGQRPGRSPGGKLARAPQETAGPQLARRLRSPMRLGASHRSVGCFSAGCGWGKVTDWPWAITFTHTQTLAPRHLPLHPTQILLAGVGAVSFLVLIGARRRMLGSPGRLMGLFALLYAGMRFPIEYLRGDVLRVSEWWSTTQILLVLVFLFGIWLVTRGRRFGSASPADSQRPEVAGVDQYWRLNGAVAARRSEA